ncbi:kinase-like protein [Serendipita vermifera]|nr:kinase-like protein [Serendipita vermifera]
MSNSSHSWSSPPHSAGSSSASQNYSVETTGNINKLLDRPVRDLTDEIQLREKHPVFYGSYSDIYDGQWAKLRVAVKVLREVKNEVEDGIQVTKRKLDREKRVWNSLCHDNILPFLGYCDQFGKYGALISPWYENGNARCYMEQESPIASRRFKMWCEVVEAVKYLHSYDPPLVHGDIKPTNVLIDNETRARLCDFGLVVVLADTSTGWTTTSSYAGTLRYRAPELLNVDGPVVCTFKGDIYALGCLGLEFIFRRLPFEQYRQPASLYQNIGSKKPPATTLPVYGTPPNAIQELWTFLQQCWHCEHEKRPSAQDVKEFVDANKQAILAALDGDIEFFPPFVGSRK